MCINKVNHFCWKETIKDGKALNYGYSALPNEISMGFFYQKLIPYEYEEFLQTSEKNDEHPLKIKGNYSSQLLLFEDASLLNGLICALRMRF